MYRLVLMFYLFIQIKEFPFGFQKIRIKIKYFSYNNFSYVVVKLKKYKNKVCNFRQ